MSDERKKTLFEKIWSGDIVEPKLFQSEDHGIMGIWDGRPATKAHYLIVPEEAVDPITDLPIERVGQLFKAASFVANHLSDLRHDILRVEFLVVGFEVPHAHIHGIPLYERDNSSAFFAPDRPERAPSNTLTDQEKATYALTPAQLGDLNAILC